MTTTWNTRNARNTVPVSEYYKIKEQIDNFKQIDLEQFTMREGATVYYKPPEKTEPKKNEGDMNGDGKDNENKCNTGNMPGENENNNNENGDLPDPNIGSLSWLMNIVGIKPIDIKPNPKRGQPFAIVGDMYKPTNRHYLENFFGEDGGANSLSDAKDKYRDFVRDKLGLDSANNLNDTFHSKMNDWLTGVYSNDSKCVNKQHVTHDSTMILNELSKLTILSPIFWMTYNLFYIAIYQNINCYRPELPDVWEKYKEFDTKLGGNSLFKSIPAYIFEFAVYAPHFMNQAIRKCICSLPDIKTYAAVYFIVLLYIIISYKAPLQTHANITDSLQLDDTPLTGIACLITLIMGLHYWYVNWYKNFILSTFAGTLIWLLVIIIMFIINMLFITIMAPMGVPVIAFLLYIYSNWAIVFFDHSGDNMFNSLIKILWKFSKIPETISNIDTYIYKTIYDNKKKGKTNLHYITKYLFYFIYEISIILIMGGSVLIFGFGMKNAKLARAYMAIYGVFILIIAMLAYTRYIYDPPLPTADMNIFQRFIINTISFYFTGSMNYLNDLYEFTELTDCNNEISNNKDEYKECNVEVLDKKVNETVISKVKRGVTDFVKNQFGSKGADLEKQFGDISKLKNPKEIFEKAKSQLKVDPKEMIEKAKSQMGVDPKGLMGLMKKDGDITNLNNPIDSIPVANMLKQSKDFATNPQNMIPQNAIPPNMIPQNAIPPNMNPPNMIPPNMIPPNMNPSNMIPPNMIPPNMIPQNAIPPITNTFSPGNIPKIEIPTLPNTQQPIKPNNGKNKLLENFGNQFDLVKKNMFSSNKK